MRDRFGMSDRFGMIAEMQRIYAPTESDLLPLDALSEVVSYFSGGADLAKSRAIESPGRTSARSRGMQSVFLDGFQTLSYGSYYERPGSLNFDSLRAMVEQTPVLSAVVLARVRQAQRFCQVQDGGDGPGFMITHVDRTHDLSKTDQQQRDLLARVFTHCGTEFDPRQRRRLRRDNFSQFVAKLARESLIYDAAAIETERQRGGTVDGFYALDGSTIRLCSEHGYDGDDEVMAVQVVGGRIVTSYSIDDLVYEPRNPRADVRLAGYGMGETEILVRVVTGFLNAMTYNARGFDDNAIPKGLLHLVGQYDERDLANFKRRWNGMVKGVNNAWALPVMTSRDADAKATFEPIGVAHDEMAFAKWMTFLVSIICAVYGMSPSEINFDSFTGGSTSALAGSDTAEKLAASKDSGLRPLLTYMEGIFSDFLIDAPQWCFRWTGLDPKDEQRTHALRLAALTVNEIRAQEGWDPLDGPLGAAPLNPSLVGPWMQVMTGGGQDQGDTTDADGAGAGGADGADAGADAGKPSGPAAGGQGDPEAAAPAQAAGVTKALGAAVDPRVWAIVS